MWKEENRWLRLVQTERVIRSRIGRFNACVKGAQIENSLSYCINACNLRRSERAINPFNSWKNIIVSVFQY